MALRGVKEMREFNLADILGMRRISIRGLGRRVADLFDALEAEGPALVTRNGRPLAVLSPITDPALRRKKALEPVTAKELHEQGLGARVAAGVPGPAGVAITAAKVEEPIPDVELDELSRTLIAEIAWFGGRAWRLNDDDLSRGLRACLTALAMLEIAHLITRRGSGFVLTRIGARYVGERIGAEFVEEAGRACYYGYPPERLGYGPPSEAAG
jgi:antitoxin (DNA-binding transcriptional repressor) of toxin-antitoxin stability system